MAGVRKSSSSSAVEASACLCLAFSELLMLCFTITLSMQMLRTRLEGLCHMPLAGTYTEAGTSTNSPLHATNE